MLETFVELFVCIKKAYLDLDKKLTFSDEDVHFLRELLGPLKIVKTTVIEICSREINLVHVDEIFESILQRFIDMDSEFSNYFFQSLSKEIRHRRTILSDSLLYLSTRTLHRPIHKLLEIQSSSKASLIELFERIAKTKFNYETTKHVVEESKISSPAANDDFETSLINITKKNIDQISQSSSTANLRDSLRAEIQHFDNGGKRGDVLNFIYESLLSVPPTSVESERAFSSAGYICSYLRVNLSDKTLNDLCYLRSYFQVRENHANEC
jgi:hypothetical protein